MRMRPFSPGAYPKDGFLSVKINNDFDDCSCYDFDDCSYYDLLIYERKLDFEETLRWELEYIGAFNEI